LEAPHHTPVGVRARFLHIVERRVARVGNGASEFVDELTVAGERHLAWQEATEREIAGAIALGTPAVTGPIDIDGGRPDQPLLDGGATAGAIVRSWEGLSGALELRSEPIAEGVFRVTASIANTTPWVGGRDAAQACAFISTHLLLETAAGEFASAI